MDNKIRVAAVSYLNTKPLVYGFEQGMMQDEVELIFEYPAKVAALLANGQVDIGLVPIATLPQLREHHIISNCGIASSHTVASVCLFSEVPLKEIRKILLDYQSKTSVALLRILIRDNWAINPDLTDTHHDFEQEIAGTTAGLLIGDRALQHRKKSAFTYDLAEEWVKMTHLPFLFAAWVSNKKFSEEFLHSFNVATGYGPNHLREIVAANPFPDYDLNTYYTQNINYHLDDTLLKSMHLFLDKMASLK